MKLRILLEDEEPQQKLRKGALELQTYLLDLEHMDLDVELASKYDDIITLKYYDKNNLVRGLVSLEAKLESAGTVYKAWAFDNGIIYAHRDGLNAAMILLKMLLLNIPFKPFEQSIMSTFGTTDVTAANKAMLAKDEVYGASVAPPFKLEGDRQATLMVHNQKIVQLIVVCITSASTVRLHVHDSNGDVNTFEGPSIVSTFPKLREFIKTAQEEIHSHQ